MICIMGTMISNRMLFIHSHKLADGTVVTHAHPYNKSDDSSPFKSHNHTRAELLFTENSEILFPLLFLVIGIFLIPLKVRRFSVSTLNFSVDHICLVRDRAPPFS